MLFHDQQVVGFAKDVYKMTSTECPKTLLFTVLNNQWTYHSLINCPVVLARSDTYIADTAETDERHRRRVEKSRGNRYTTMRCLYNND